MKFSFKWAENKKKTVEGILNENKTEKNLGLLVIVFQSEST